MEKHKITKEIEALSSNKEKYERWFSLGLHPKWGLSAELTQLMYKLYEDASGDSQYNGKWNCSACADTIYRKMKDFMTYGDNLGKPLINWDEVQEENDIETLAEAGFTELPVQEKPVKRRRKKKTNDDNETGTDNS